MDDEIDLGAVASRLSRLVEHWAGAAGFSGEDLAAKDNPMHGLSLGNLSPRDQFRVMVLLARVPVIGTMGYRIDSGLSWGVYGWRFWAAHKAPEGAFIPGLPKAKEPA